MFRPATSRRLVAVWLALATLLCVAFALRLPVTVPEPVYFADAKAWSPSTPIADTFTPLAYPLFLGPALRIAGTGGVLALQAVLQLAMVAAAFALLLLLEASPRAAGLGALPILLHPEFLLSVPKMWDVPLSSFLFLLVVVVCVLVQRNGPAWGLCLAVGLVFGAALFCRPNFALLAPVVAAAFWRVPAKVFAVRIAFAALIAAVTFAVAGIAAHGRPFWPRNGPYNLYAGDNPFSSQALLEKLNAEPSIDLAFRATHADLIPADPAKGFYYSAALEHIYTHDALTFIVHRPGEQAQLVAIKLFTLFRPDTKVHPLRSASGLGKAVLALPALLFSIALLAPGRPRLRRADWLLLAFAAAYVLPFLLTNSDPRFRTPLDALLILFTVSLLFRRYAAAAPTDGAV